MPAPNCGSSAAGPTMSRRTAPTSIAASWSGSPTSTSWASSRTASTSRTISESGTIEVSSTITRSWGRRLLASWRKRPPGSQPNSRWIVEARTLPPTASCNRAAALPVGAHSPIRGGCAEASAASASVSATIRATVVVLPVPGPPAITVRSRSSATAAAVRCSANSSAGNAALIAVPSSARSPMSARMRLRARSAAASRRSSRQ